MKDSILLIGTAILVIAVIWGLWCLIFDVDRVYIGNVVAVQPWGSGGLMGSDSFLLTLDNGQVVTTSQPYDIGESYYRDKVRLGI